MTRAYSRCFHTCAAFPPVIFTPDPTGSCLIGSKYLTVLELYFLLFLTVYLTFFAFQLRLNTLIIRLTSAP